MKPQEYSERNLEVAGWPVHLTTYKLGDKFYSMADNVSPGACLARTTADTKEEAEAQALAKAERLLGRTRRIL
ncbi:MAG: hypothetical protein KJZ78_16930 [Bryobacteraceae bacterium]|nr:hypothetical protein [Bryobacteraceae bacterium]HEU0142281.1 hypothetical protein [Bryobacteraceae bacterium]